MDFRNNGTIVQIEAAKQSDQSLVDAAREIAKAAEARGLQLPMLGGSTAVAETAQVEAVEAPSEPARTIEVSELRESLFEKLEATFIGYQTIAKQLNAARHIKDRFEVATEETVNRELTEWLNDENTEQKMAYAKAVMEADPTLVAVLVATPNVEADASDQEEVARAFAANGKQPYPTYLNSWFISMFSAQELSGTNPDNGNAVQFSIHFSDVNPELEGTCSEQVAKLAELQKTYPDVRVSSLLEDLTFWSTLRAQGDKLADGADTFYKTYSRKFNLEPRGDNVLTSYVGVEGEPFVFCSYVETYHASVVVG